MITHTVSIDLPTVAPDQVWTWLLDMNPTKYRQWHSDHINFRVQKITKDILGSVLFFDECIGGEFRIRFKWVVTAYAENSSIVTCP